MAHLDPPSRPRSLWPLAWISAAVVLAVGGALLYVALHDPGTHTASQNPSSSTTSIAESSPPPPSPSAEPSDPAAVVSRFEQALNQARENHQISDDTAAKISEKLDNLRNQLDENGGRLGKRVRDLTKTIDELQKDEEIDATIAQQLKDILAPLGAD